MADTLTDFLLARVAEDEDAVAFYERQWPGTTWFGWLGGANSMSVSDEYADLIVNPVRVLAECDAKRRIIAQYQDAKHHYDAEHDADGSAKYSDGAVWSYLDKLEQWEIALRLLGLPYDGHPAFRDEWRPA